ncbi:hypothetical protein ADZ36_16790 [Streptomyces fradiae]|uniref:Uncharacterized protein n=2 Tax=Streptomyces TaxID=1883 RepID=A0A3M8F1U8_9ACTN|nr:hypothetical protein ADZ36_16790 [Streptomyces fradiae]OFA48229.1 hypothetical protein BEN35_18975 [Streptomyces fradiae]PQM20705.1 hypothetical protein Sfr7A_26350 [Streptomyces xinghaiensis]RKM92646.1 hypothetical protein SFRA_025005 [Streptomyces xinghaiensis]RNC70614.1 hypothetical protein DC095_025995 [Streptomyces xinghaiensis]
MWVRVGDALVRGDTIVGVTVSDPHYRHETFKIMLKVTGHRDPLWLDSGIYDDDQGAGREQVDGLADAFVDTLARGAAMPSGALIRFDPDEDDSGWVLSSLG